MFDFTLFGFMNLVDYLKTRPILHRVVGMTVHLPYKMVPRSMFYDKYVFSLSLLQILAVLVPTRLFESRGYLPMTYRPLHGGADGELMARDGTTSERQHVTQTKRSMHHNPPEPAGPQVGRLARGGQPRSSDRCLWPASSAFSQSFAKTNPVLVAVSVESGYHFDRLVA